MGATTVAAAKIDERYDVVVVGGGAAGVSGAKILARSRRSVLVVDGGAPRNAPAEGVHNYLYAEGAAPARLVEIGRAEAAGYDVDIVEGRATAAAVRAETGPGGSRFTVQVALADGGTASVAARRMLLATGLVDVLPPIAGLAARWGKDVLHCPFCHGWEVRDQAIGVIGTSAMALHQVLLFGQLTDDLIYFQHTAPDPSDAQLEQLAALGIRHLVGQVAAVHTDADGHALTGVEMVDGRVIARQAVAIATVLDARDDLVADLGLELSVLELGGVAAGRYLPADPSGATATPGVWTAGNVSAPMAQVIASASAGAAAGAAIHLDLIGEDTALAVAALRARTPVCWSTVFSNEMEAEVSRRVLGDRCHGLVL